MIQQSQIRRYSASSDTRPTERMVEEARLAGRQTAFLSHSHKDRDLAMRLQAFMHANGWRVYIDWQDTTMPSTPNRETAQKIKDRIRRLDWFLYLATANSAASRWCPWEIGYADGTKGVGRVIIVPTRDSQGYNYGSEYLELYRRVDLSDDRRYGVFGPDNKGTLFESIRP